MAVVPAEEARAEDRVGHLFALGKRRNMFALKLQTLHSGYFLLWLGGAKAFERNFEGGRERVALPGSPVTHSLRLDRLLQVD